MATFETNAVPVDIVDEMKRVTVTVKLKRMTELKWRIQLGKCLVGLAARVMNCKIEIVE